MTDAKFRRTLVGAAIATALGLLGDPATAAPYRGTFDPPSFFGEFTINVSPDCLAQENGWYANEVESICDATLVSAIAEVHPPNTYDGVLTFGPVFSQSQLFGLYILDGNIDSFDTALIHHASGVPDPISPQEFWIQFVSGRNASSALRNLYRHRPDAAGGLPVRRRVRRSRRRCAIRLLRRGPRRPRAWHAEPAAGRPRRRLARPATTKGKSPGPELTHTSVREAPAVEHRGGRCFWRTRKARSPAGLRYLRQSTAFCVRAARCASARLIAISSCHVCPSAHAASNAASPRVLRAAAMPSSTPSRCAAGAAARAVRAPPRPRRRCARTPASSPECTTSRHGPRCSPVARHSSRLAWNARNATPSFVARLRGVAARDVGLADPPVASASPRLFSATRATSSERSKRARAAGTSPASNEISPRKSSLSPSSSRWSISRAMARHCSKYSRARAPSPTCREISPRCPSPIASPIRSPMSRKMTSASSSHFARPFGVALVQPHRPPASTASRRCRQDCRSCAAARDKGSSMRPASA